MSEPIIVRHNQPQAGIWPSGGAKVPRTDRLDRVTRTVQRLLDVPMAILSVGDLNMQRVRSAQGLTIHDSDRHLPLLESTLSAPRALMVPDASQDPRFHNDPVVVGDPGVRSYLGVPLHISPGVPIGTLCALDDEVRPFSYQDVQALQDVAAMAEAELRLDAMTSRQRQMKAALSDMERRANVDPATGCWNVRGFRELVARSVGEAVRDEGTLALCYVKVRDVDLLTQGMDRSSVELMRQLLAQVLRRRLPERGALASLGTWDFCALVPGATQLGIEERLAEFTFPQLRLEIPGLRCDLELKLAFGLAFLEDMNAMSPATELWATALANLRD